MAKLIGNENIMDDKLIKKENIFKIGVNRFEIILKINL